MVSPAGSQLVKAPCRRAWAYQLRARSTFLLCALLGLQLANQTMSFDGGGVLEYVAEHELPDLQWLSA